jgi:hypothetical protein
MRHVPRLALVALLLAAARGVRAQTQVLIVSGLGGEPAYSAAFAGLSARLAGALHTRYGVPDSDIVWLGESATNKEPHYGGASTKAHVEAAMERMAARARPGSEFVLVLIGHGSGSEDQTRISLPGPDLTAADLRVLLTPLTKARVAVLDLTSASGDALAVLSAPNRVVITATKSAYERNETHFAGFFVDALTRSGADVDKDGRVSLLEAFQYAARETARMYSDAGLIQTEHAQLDDDGDGQGTGNPTGRSGDGMLARRFFLDAGAAAPRVVAHDPELAALYTRRFALTDSVQGLEARKSAMPDSAYESQLERLLIALARAGHAIRAIEGPGHAPAPSGGGR